MNFWWLDCEFGLFLIFFLTMTWGVLLVLGAAHLFVDSICHALAFIDVNNAFSYQAMDFFTKLAEQLLQGNIHEELLTPPSLTGGLLLSAFGFLALAGGAAAVWTKPRWWTWLPVCLGLRSFSCFSEKIFSIA